MNFPMLLPILLTPLFIFYLNMNYSNAKSGKETWNVFSDESVEKFYHLAVDENGRWVYLTAANHIYQLSTDLQLQINYTISELSPSDCTAANCSHKLKRNTTRFGWADGDVLLLDYQNQRMISCWTFFLGICHAHDISNISKIWRTWFEPIVESELSNPIVAFIAPSLTKNSSTPLQTLYASCTPITTIGNVRKAQQKYFSSVITQNSTSYFTRNVCSPLPGDILVYGFSSENVGYFIAGNSAREHTANGYLIVIDTNKNNSCNKVSVLCSSGPDVNTAHKIAYAYIQKQNPDSGLKTDILYTLQNNNRNEGIRTISVCRHQMNKLHSQIRKHEPLIGELIFLRRPAKVWVTAMVVTSINNYTILFLGTREGRLLKISIEGIDSPDLSTGSKYAVITTDAGNKVHSDMVFDSTMNFLYLMTRNKLTKIKIHNCDEYNTSHVCLETKDPYCGWCFLSNRCCLKSECDGEQNGIDWVSFDIGKYIDASSINPEYTFSRTAKLKNVTFKLITPHPFINHTIMCLFEFSNFSINSTTICNENTSSINCVIPIRNHLPPTPMGNHSIGAQLSVQTNHLPAFQKFLIQFFDCTTYKSCFSCIISPYPCHWYANEHRCKDNAIWKEDDTVIGISFSSTNFPQRNIGSLYDGTKYSKNAMFCPQFFFKNKSDIYIPAQTEKTQQIQVYYRTPELWYHINRKYTCKFVFDSNDIKFAAIYDYEYKDSVQGNGMIEGEFKCNDTFFYAESKPFITVEMSVSLNGSKPLENMYNTRIIVYKCAHMGNQCTTCLNKNYSCVWNSESRECKYYSLNYTSNITDPWLHDIRDCSNSTILRKNQSTNWLTENINFIITLIVAVTFTVVAVFVIYCRASAVRSRKMQQQMNKMGMQMISMSQCVKRVVIENEIELDENESDILRLPNVSIVYQPFPTLSENETEPKNEYELPLDKKWEIPRENLVLGKFLGQGEFGRVVKGSVSGHSQQHNVTTVAVKMLKNGHSDVDVINLVKEMELMKLIGRHDNVLSILGCCTQDGPLLIITEYSPHGNLLDFLRNHNRDLFTTAQEMTSIDLSETVLITFAQQVAKGMEYLASIKCIHRDLAARNVLVFDNHIVKIGDFGLARDIRHEYYYRQKTNGKFPLKWMAPESLKHCRYTIQSDVWSYGILVWEIMTFGTVPYLAYDDAEKLIQDIEAGYRMNKPNICPEMLYCLMRKCWNYLPKDRPNFTTIIRELDAILAAENKVMEQPDPHCSNIDTESDHEESETDSLLLLQKGY